MQKFNFVRKAENLIIQKCTRLIITSLHHSPTSLTNTISSQKPLIIIHQHHLPAFTNITIIHYYIIHYYSSSFINITHHHLPSSTKITHHHSPTSLTIIHQHHSPSSTNLTHHHQNIPTEDNELLEHFQTEERYESLTFIIVRSASETCSCKDYNVKLVIVKLIMQGLQVLIRFARIYDFSRQCIQLQPETPEVQGQGHYSWKTWTQDWSVGLLFKIPP